MSAARFLDGIRVLDLSQFVPGPFATLWLADLGAEVIKVEPPQGDPQRIDGPLDGDGLSVWYRLINRNKVVTRIDLKTAAGRAAFDALVTRADVLMESYRPGVLDRLGYTRERLGALNPRLIHCALSGWGQNGPARLRAGHDLNYLAMAGVLDTTGTAAAPVMTNPPFSDYSGAMASVGLICAALYGRERTGRGCYIDVGMSDAALATMATELTAATHAGFNPRRGVGPFGGGWACYNIYATADGRHVTLGAMETKFWVNFCTLVDRPEWIARQLEPRPQSDLTGEVAALFASRDLAHWCDLLEPHDTCFQAVLDLGEVAADPQIEARRMVSRQEAGIVDVLLPAWIDGAPPPGRAAFEELSAEAALARWAAEGGPVR